MSKFIRFAGATLVLCGSLLSLNSATADDRPADRIVAEIKAIEMPVPPRNRNDRAAMQEFVLKQRNAAAKRSELIGELLKSDPNSAELPSLILERWQAIITPGPKADAMNAEIDSVLASGKNEKLVAEGAFIRGVVAMRKAGQDADASTILPIAEAFIKKAPKDARGALFLAAVASKLTDTTKADELKARIEKDYPDSPVAKQFESERRLKVAIGKPFPLEFTEAIKGTPITMAGLKGKVVILDFWATWCGPCVQEMPNMKKLYAEYKDKGVEFIGVSLDRPKAQGGFDSLKKYVETNKIEWPQYYKDDGSAGEFASAWGVNAIPTVFAVDADGNLFTMEARGQLEKLIPELLEKAKASKKAEAKP